MFYSKVSSHTYLIRLVKGEEVNNSIKKFCIDRKIDNGSLTALGSVENPTLAHYRVDTKKYTEKKLKGIFEITNLTGTVGLVQNEPLVHTHVTLSDEDMNALGGHLVEAIVSATVELLVTQFDTYHEKKFDEEIGLKLFELADSI